MTEQAIPLSVEEATMRLRDACEGWPQPNAYDEALDALLAALAVAERERGDLQDGLNDQLEARKADAENYLAVVRERDTLREKARQMVDAAEVVWGTENLRAFQGSDYRARLWRDAILALDEVLASVSPKGEAPCGESRLVNVMQYDRSPIEQTYTCSLPAGHDGAHVGGALMWPSVSPKGEA
jgi:hypothetical protein